MSRNILKLILRTNVKKSILSPSGYVFDNEMHVISRHDSLMYKICKVNILLHDRATDRVTAVTECCMDTTKC